jgi:uncharacterized protein YjiS (DUF1127 family)
MTAHIHHISILRVPSPIRWFTRAQAVWQERQALAGLDPARLRDIGLSADEAMSEASRPFWDLPH